MSNLMDEFFHFEGGQHVKWGGEEAVVLEYRAIECHGGACRQYLVRHGLKSYWVEPYEIEDHLGNEGVAAAMSEIGFAFAVSDLVHFRSPGRKKAMGAWGRIHASFVVTERVYASRQGLWQRAYTLNTEKGIPISEVVLELATMEASEDETATE